MNPMHDMNASSRHPRNMSNLATKLTRIRARHRRKFQQHGPLDWLVRFESKGARGDDDR
jgi:hypothetical protein